MSDILFMAGPPDAVARGAYTIGPDPRADGFVSLMQEGDLLVCMKDFEVIYRQQLREGKLVPYE